MIAVRSGAGSDHDRPFDSEICQGSEARLALLGRADDRKCIDEFRCQRPRLRRTCARMMLHVVLIMQLREDLLSTTRDGACEFSVHDLKTREGGESAAHEIARNRNIIVANHIDVGTEAKSIRIEAGPVRLARMRPGDVRRMYDKELQLLTKD